jgi:hypothetical protein
VYTNRRTDVGIFNSRFRVVYAPKNGVSDLLGLLLVNFVAVPLVTLTATNNGER